MNTCYGISHSFVDCRALTASGLQYDFRLSVDAVNLFIDDLGGTPFTFMITNDTVSV